MSNDALDERPPVSTARHEFDENLDYALEIVRGGRLLERLGVTGFDVAALYRAAWMQAVTAVDRWIHRELYSRATALALDPAIERPPAFRRMQIPMELFEDVRHHGADLGEAFTGYLERTFGYQSLQNPRRIEEALAHVSPVKLWATVAKRLNAGGGGALSGKDVTGRLAGIVHRRNHIAHEADRDPDRPGHRLPMSDADVTDVIEWLWDVVSAIEDALGPAPQPPAGPEPRPAVKRAASRWSRGELTTALADVEGDLRDAILRLLDHADSCGATFKGGIGPDPSAGFYYPNVDGQRRSLWSLFLTPGKPSISLNVASVRDVDEKLALRLLAVARRTPELDAALLEPDDVLLGKYPNLDLRPLTATKAPIDGLLEALDAVLTADS